MPNSFEYDYSINWIKIVDENLPFNNGYMNSLDNACF